MKSLELKLNKIRKESIKLCDKVLESWKTFKEKGLGDYKKFELENSELVNSWKNKQKEEAELKKIVDEGFIKKMEEEKKEELEQSKNEFWITTPNYSSQFWGDKTVKIEWNDEDGELITDKFEMNDKVVKLGDNWFKMVKLPVSNLPNWLNKQRERERETN